ncbi:GlsB/YeaQ/YmgE family stress response membrane protein [Pelagibacterium halotolerans]|uniref:GlsB/YeaQ/YmgE family stress response membrane protein n=1 Tax=Pelagibacterium halotolerans TaxID=531813 RepID=UPI00384D38D3
MDAKSLIVFLLVGVAAGFLASLVVGGSGGLIAYLIAGVLGSFVGGYLFSALKIDLKLGNPVISQIVTSTVGAIIVIVIARIIT